MFRISRADGVGRSRTVDPVDLMAACAELSNDGAHKLEIVNLDAIAPASRPVVAAPDTIRAPAPTPTPAASFSSFGSGGLTTDDTAKARIDRQHASLIASGAISGVGMGSGQFFENGTRMASDGYRTQATRKAAHDRALPLSMAAEHLSRLVQEERREDREVSAGELARAITVNGPVAAYGLTLNGNAIAQLADRIESPMRGYILGVCERIQAETVKGDAANRAAIEADKATVADVISHECRRNPDVPLKLRTRQTNGDVFAILSQSYANADAPEVLPELVEAMPDDARATCSYDPDSTGWEIRASIWTPTPVAAQAVGEPFEGFTSVRGRDNGGGSLRGGGGISVLRCLNASVYLVGNADMRRRHVGRVMVDLSKLLAGSIKAIDALCDAWGRGRKQEVQAPAGVPIDVAIPGFWRYCLKNDRALAGVLPGKTESHVEGLTRAFHAERREPSRVVAADMAQGWTRYIQDTPDTVRREAEGAIASWLVAGAPAGFTPAKRSN